MLIEEFIRVGRALLESAPRPEQVLRLVTDVTDQTVKNFYRNVFVVLLPANEDGEVSVLPRQEFGEENENGDFVVNIPQALGVPISLPTGGDSLEAQGQYGISVYPLYDRHMRGVHEQSKKKKTGAEPKKWALGFQRSLSEVRSFLDGRLKRTPGLLLSPSQIDQLAMKIHHYFKSILFEGANALGVLVLARCSEGEFYSRNSGSASPHRIGRIGDEEIVPDLPRILEAVLAARVEEGRGAGTRQGRCTITGEEGDLVSAYCKAWPWALPTWRCPLPGGDETALIESIALSPKAYRALVVGACFFDRVAKPLAWEVLPELFSPAETRAGKDQAQRRSELPAIQGAALVTPLLDNALVDPADAQAYVEGLWSMLARPADDATMTERSLSTIVGFDVVPPDGLAFAFRLTLAYFHGEVSRGDVHLRATIHDVVPSTVQQLRGIARSEGREGLNVLRLLMPKLSEKQVPYLGALYQSVPYLLARGYGGAFLWPQLERLLHRNQLDLRRVVANTARRLEGLVSKWPDTYFILLDEVGFLLHMQRFVQRINREVADHQPENQTMATRHWRELLTAYQTGPARDMTFDTIAELGFACGLLVRCFNVWYGRVLGVNKDYLRDRVLTFGASLSPQDVWRRAIMGIREVAYRYEKLRKLVEVAQLLYREDEEQRREYRGDFEQKLGVVLSALECRAGELTPQRDEFMTGFWSGYALQGIDQPRKKVASDTSAATVASSTP